MNECSAVLYRYVCTWVCVCVCVHVCCSAFAKTRCSLFCPFPRVPSVCLLAPLASLADRGEGECDLLYCAVLYQCRAERALSWHGNCASDQSRDARAWQKSARERNAPTRTAKTKFRKQKIRKSRRSFCSPRNVGLIRFFGQQTARTSTDQQPIDRRISAQARSSGIHSITLL